MYTFSSIFGETPYRAINTVSTLTSTTNYQTRRESYIKLLYVFVSKSCRYLVEDLCYFDKPIERDLLIIKLFKQFFDVYKILYKYLLNYYYY